MRQKLIEPKIKMSNEKLQSLVISQGWNWHSANKNSPLPSGEFSSDEALCIVEWFPEENIISIHFLRDEPSERIADEFIEYYNSYESTHLKAKSS